jgi:hypothetical protein
LRHRRFEADPAEQKGSQPMSETQPDKSSDSAWEPADKDAGRNGSGPGSTTVDLEDNQPETPGKPVKISLWGPPGSGKTTYLAALRQAALSAAPSIGQWNIIPDDDSSEDRLIKWSNRLVVDRMFPEQTELGEEISLQWLFLGNLAGSRYDHRRFGRRRRLECKFLLDLVDVSGEAFRDPPGEGQDKVQRVPPQIRERALDHLEEADGLIYLFDPITERDHQSATMYLNGTLTNLSKRMRKRVEGHQLPKDVSVCVTKFDRPEIFNLARKAHLVNYGPDGMPRVLDKDAECFFDILCKEDVWDQHEEEGNASAKFVHDNLRNWFHPDRIQYYVTSSIGYRRPPGWDPAETVRPGYEFNPTNFNNVDMIKDGELIIPKIQGPIHPINVLEPLISLQQRAAARRT